MRNMSSTDISSMWQARQAEHSHIGSQERAIPNASPTQHWESAVQQTCGRTRLQLDKCYAHTAATVRRGAQGAERRPVPPDHVPGGQDDRGADHLLLPVAGGDRDRVCALQAQRLLPALLAVQPGHHVHRHWCAPAPPALRGYFYLSVLVWLPTPGHRVHWHRCSPVTNCHKLTQVFLLRKLAPGKGTASGCVMCAGVARLLHGCHHDTFDMCMRERCFG